jgi:UDP-3-O-[3-hydroxymyristoyl] glucosamine N-acyltransferase
MSRVWTIFGTGAHARKACHCAVLGGDTVAAFVDENAAARAPVADVPVLPAAALSSGAPGELFVAIGNAEARRRLMDQCAAQGWRLPALVHPKASVAPDAVLGEGVLVAAGAVIESGAHIGRGSIVDIGVLVDHDCVVAAFTHLRPGQVCAAGSAWPV